MKNKWLLFLFILQLGLFADNSDNRKTMENYLLNKAKTPASVIIKYLQKESSRVNILATPGYCETIDFFRYLVPALSHSGIHELGVWFLNSDDELKINRYLAGLPGAVSPESLLYSCNPLWGYSEYIDFLNYIREFNLSAGNSDSRFSLIGLNGNGNQETRLNWIHSDFDLPDSVEDSLFFEIMSPLPGTNGSGASLPYAGVLDTLLYKLPDWKRYAAVPLKGNPLWIKELNILSGEESDFLIIMGPASEFTPVTPIDDFIKQDDLYRIKERLSDKHRTNPPELGTALANARIRAYIKNLTP